MKITNDDGEEIEVFTAEEVQARESAAVAAKEAEYKPKVDELSGKLDEAQKALGVRANEFAQFRKLSDEAVAKLSEAERTIYENGLVLQKEREDRAAADKSNRDAAVKAIIKAKAGTNAALEKRMEELWPVIGVEATTPEELEKKSMMVLGALSTTQPDLVATVAGFSGGYTPPAEKGKEGETFADTDKGKAAAADLGLILEPPKKN